MIADTGGFGGIGILTFYEKLRSNKRMFIY
jgi:hypothetical protein